MLLFPGTLGLERGGFAVQGPRQPAHCMQREGGVETSWRKETGLMVLAKGFPSPWSQRLEKLVPGQSFGGWL